MDIQSIKNRFGLVGQNERYYYSLNVAMQVAPTNLSVLITGESGTGKEAFSQIIHQLSPRKHNQFIAINCGAIPEGTIDSELFGHEKGAFTGAAEGRKGYFEVVSGGTIFLDEIGEMPVSTQARLLRVLESGEFIKVGSSRPQKTDVRIIAATNVNLWHLLSHGKFREDLYYRLNTVPIFVPPLRERREDIPLLFRKFATDYANKYHTQAVQLSPEAVNLLIQYRWPGNIRELKNLAEQISLLATDKLIEADTLQNFLPSERNHYAQVPVIYGSGFPLDDLDAHKDKEMIYNFLYDLRREVKDLKKVVQHIVDHINLDPALYSTPDAAPFINSGDKVTPLPYTVNTLHTDAAHNFSANETEENLSLAEKEKELITKALKKHKGRRKDAAKDLGISERTLYRKIGDYNIPI